jgi:lipoprotein-releasing system permease protein
MYKLILAFRYLFKKRVSYFALTAVALCVFIVVVVMTVMRGLVTDFKQKNHSFAGDCVVAGKSLVGFPYYRDFVSTLEQQNFIEAVSPVINSYALINPAGSDKGVGVEIMGIDPARHSRATGFGKTLHYNKNRPEKAFVPDYDPNLVGCVLGVNLAIEPDAKGRYYHSAETIRTSLAVSCFPLTARGALARASTGLVNTKTFYYSDTSHSGLARIDSSMVYLPFEQAQLLCGMAGPEMRASSLHVKFKPHITLAAGCDKVASLWRRFVEEKSGEKLANLLEQVSVQTWKQSRREFIAAMEKEQTMLIVMFALVGLTTVFIVFVVFFMIVSHKSKDIGILKSIGVSNSHLVQIFLGFAFLVGLLGSFVGLILGWLFLSRINRIEDWLFTHFHFQLWDRTIFAIGDIPNHMDLSLLTVITASAVTACLLGALVPTRQAAKLNPVQTLQVSQL